MSNDGSTVGNQQQSNYGANNLSYFEQEISRQPHSSVASSVSDPVKMDAQSMQSAEGSPPPASVPTSGSSASGSQTPTSHTEKAVDVPISHAHEGKPHSTSYQSAIKLMVSNNVAGSIIGRAGQTISELQTQSSARIKLSQTGDYYPGTQEQQHTQHSWQPRKGTNAAGGFDFVVRLLVPSSSCGMIIGKGGANIKHMEETSGVASVRLSPKEGPDQGG
eukprot:CAMPEP_0116111586 /NCGR_PEP_ID=MMETSP0327-20121206/18527_1 /TAXON_ID=44447 /ORGANISM="Pseudo-nitzschia delicatissima, Strain B596" /LENGTH=218 /DNA_ID=CAMNT_0003604833 /DNA_START=128 /DNA_END=780 /DNA_ORIENTATION=+